MNVLIRADCGGVHGLGHSVRMKALAQELAACGASVSFVASTPALKAFVAPFPCVEAWHPNESTRGCDVYVIDTKEEQWGPGEFVRWHTRGIRVVRIDHPHATSASCDLLIGPCAHWPTETVSTLLASFGNRFLCGWDYAMLAPEVTQHQPIPYAERVNGPIVFCAGGSDPSDVLPKMFNWIRAQGWGWYPDVTKVFAIPAARAEEPVPKFRPTKSYFEPFTRELLREAALVVSLFGVTAYEAIYFQTPTLLLAHTDENRQGAALLEAATPAVRFCDALSLTHGQERFCLAVQQLWQAEGERYGMHLAASGLIDGRGTERVAEAIMRL